MSFRITGLAADRFQHLFGLSDSELAEHGVQRRIADANPGFPDRIELRDAEPGETVLLLNYTHQPAATPYRASHAIYVLENPVATYDRVDTIPEVMRIRTMSLRAFDADHMLAAAELADGREATASIERLLSMPAVAYIQAHYAKFGCYAARIDRA